MGRLLLSRLGGRRGGERRGKGEGRWKGWEGLERSIGQTLLVEDLWGYRVLLVLWVSYGVNNDRNGCN